MTIKRYYLVNLFLIAVTMALLAHFALIIKQGTVVIQEPNPIILAIEVALLLTIIAFGIINIVRLIHG